MLEIYLLIAVAVTAFCLWVFKDREEAIIISIIMGISWPILLILIIDYVGKEIKWKKNKNGEKNTSKK